MNPVQLWCWTLDWVPVRDETIADVIARFGATKTDQIARAFFQGPSAKRAAQARLHALEIHGWLNRQYQVRGGTIWMAPGLRGADLERKVAVSEVWVAPRVLLND